MALTETQYRDIMNHYDQLRFENNIIEQMRLEQILSVIPEIKEINEGISSFSIACAKKLLFQTDESMKEKLHARIEASVQKKRELLVQHGFPEDYLDPIYECPHCKDTGYIEDQKCSCFQSMIRELIYQQSNLMDAIPEQNFDHFCMDYYSDQPVANQVLTPRENMNQVLDSCFAFIRHMQADVPDNLLILGNPGVGKTFLSTCIAGEVMKLGKSVLYLTSYQLFEQLADHTFHRNDSRNRSNNSNHNDDRDSRKASGLTLQQILDADLLIIDDLGTEMNNTFINSQLFLCINERILSKKSTIINTNFSLNQISKTYTERISSRLIQFYNILYIFGEDIRIKKAFSPIDESASKML